MATDLSALAPFADNPDVVAYLQALQAGGQQPANSSTPFDAGLTSAYGAADENYANTIAAINAQQPAIQRTYGFDASGGVDPSNPFGRAQLLQRSYQQSKRGINNNMASRGQLYSGATQRAQNDAQFNYQANDAALRNEYGQQLAALSAQRATAANTRNDAKSSAYWNWVNAQIAARAADPTGGGAMPVAGGAQTAGYGTVAGPDGTPLNAGLVAQASQLGGAAAPDAPPSPTFASYGNDPAVVAYLQALYQAQQKPKPTGTPYGGLGGLVGSQGGPNNGTGGARPR